MSPPRHRALLVDDQALIGKAVARLLAGADDIVLEFQQDAATALAAAEAFRPTVILQDLVMPDIEGLEMVRRFRELSVTAEVPVIVLSALAEAEKKAELLAGGAADYLVKLPDAVELVARIRIHSEAYHRLVERNAAFAALEKSHADLAWERERSERLLRSILPQAIAERLKDSPGTIAEGFPEATVLFADLVGFTTFSRSADPRGLVEMLDAIFSEFDRLAAAAGIEKIKTIGDAYMAVAGLPEPRPDHAVAAAEMALGMRDAFAVIARDRNLPLGLRIGIHSGPVVAGVIGRHKFSYDLWGDTVNLASRMESHGAAGMIHISAATRAILGERFRFEPRGGVTVKGSGLMETFFLHGPA
ncbi:MAG: response regulator [Planctomycetia bacterium]|jgi:class 3 adenylate cyclase/CheY-like chemotaxis protein|nr:response regulator [Planctomycetia bacterium]